MSTDTNRKTAKIVLKGVSLSPLIHGAGNSGNTVLLRMQDIVNPCTGQRMKVPFISSNSFKGRIRRAAAEYALRTMNVPRGSLSKPVVDLLFCGGHLSKGGQSVPLQAARDIERLFPALSLCAYSAGVMMMRSKLEISDVYLVCEENAWRMPEVLRGLPQASMRAGRFRDELFGTRLEPSRQPVAASYLSHEAKGLIEGRAEDAEGSLIPMERGDSAQMIYNTQCVVAGAVWWCEMLVRDVTDAEIAALQGALSVMVEGSVRLPGSDKDAFVIAMGAQNTKGFGRMAFEIESEVVRLGAPSEVPEPGAVMRYNGVSGAGMDAYNEHLKAHRDEILSVLAAVA